MSPPILLRRVNEARVTSKGSTHLSALCSGPFFTIEHAYSSNAMFPEFVDETKPSQNVPVLMRHGCKVKPLRDKCSIAGKGLVRGERGDRNALCNYITIVALERDLSRLGSCLITCGLLG